MANIKQEHVRQKEGGLSEAQHFVHALNDITIRKGVTTVIDVNDENTVELVYIQTSGPEFIKLFSCSTQVSLLS